MLKTLLAQLTPVLPVHGQNSAFEDKEAVEASMVMFHAFGTDRKRLDILTISRRLGHGSPGVALNV
jgi:hypothetical protein